MTTPHNPRTRTDYRFMPSVSGTVKNHVIPVELFRTGSNRQHAVARELLKLGGDGTAHFDFASGFDNGQYLGPEVHTGSHPRYTDVVEERLNNIASDAKYDPLFRSGDPEGPGNSPTTDALRVELAGEVQALSNELRLRSSEIFMDGSEANATSRLLYNASDAGLEQSPHYDPAELLGKSDAQQLAIKKQWVAHCAA